MWDSVDAETKKLIFDEFLKAEQEEETGDENTIYKKEKFKNFRRDNERMFKIFYID